MRLETADLVGYLKERHRRQVKSLKVKPILAIVVAGDEAASASFIRAKQRYGHDIGVVVEVKVVSSEVDLIAAIDRFNHQSNVKGIVVQLPLPSGFETDRVLNQVEPPKDVDGLGSNSPYEVSAAKGILWLLSSINLDLQDRKVAVIGQGRLIGQPVAAMLEASGAQVERLDEGSDLAAIGRADIVISGTGQAGLIRGSMLKAGAVVIDAGTSQLNGKLRGDADPDLYDDPAIKVTPVPGGVGPLTVAALFDNLLIAAS